MLRKHLHPLRRPSIQLLGTFAGHAVCAVVAACITTVVLLIVDGWRVRRGFELMDWGFYVLCWQAAGVYVVIAWLAELLKKEPKS